MFSWFRKKRKPTNPAPAADPAQGGGVPPVPDVDHDSSTAKPSGGAAEDIYPRLGTSARIAFTNGERTWTEEADLLHVLARTLGQNGHPTAVHDDGLRHVASGIVLCPELCGFHPLDRGGVSTATVVEARHPDFGGARVFEYQHSTGADVEQSLAAGFDQWRQVDLPVLLDALRAKPADCMALERTSPAADGSPRRTRRFLLGPVAHYRQRPLAHGPDGEAEHVFCPCCLFTRTIDAFRSQMESDGFYAVRFYAARDADGTPQADCRVNGQDWEAGKAALLNYVATWPDAGFEFRKQYAVLQSVAPSADPAGGEVTDR